MGVRQPDAGRLDQQPQPFRVGRLRRPGGSFAGGIVAGRAERGGRFLGREDRLVERPVGQAHAALAAARAAGASGRIASRTTGPAKCPGSATRSPGHPAKEWGWVSN